jgi:hypothetical protein
VAAGAGDSSAAVVAVEAVAAAATLRELPPAGGANEDEVSVMGSFIICRNKA